MIDSESLDCTYVGGFGGWGGGWKGVKVIASDGLLPWMATQSPTLASTGVEISGSISTTVPAVTTPGVYIPSPATWPEDT